MFSDILGVVIDWLYYGDLYSYSAIMLSWLVVLVPTFLVQLLRFQRGKIFCLTYLREPIYLHIYRGDP